MVVALGLDKQMSQLEVSEQQSTLWYQAKLHKQLKDRLDHNKQSLSWTKVTKLMIKDQD